MRINYKKTFRCKKSNHYQTCNLLICYKHIYVFIYIHELKGLYKTFINASNALNANIYCI